MNNCCWFNYHEKCLSKNKPKLISLNNVFDLIPTWLCRRKGRFLVTFLWQKWRLGILRKYWWISLSISTLPIQSQCTILLVGKENCNSQHTSKMLEMDQNLEQRDFSKNTANEIPRRETGGRENSNKCNQCNFASSRAEETFENIKWRKVIHFKTRK